MAMVTTCPHCATSFNVDPAVLMSRNGRVRCGQCKQVFDGLLTAVTLEEFQAKAATQLNEGETEAVPVVASPTVAPESAPAPEAYWPALPDTPDVPVPPMPLEIAAAASADHLPQEPVAQDAVTPEAVSEASPWTASEPAQVFVPTAPATVSRVDTDDDREFDDPAPSPTRARWLWAVAATLAGLLLAGQLLYRYRSELAANFPVTKPALVQVCAWAGCSVPPLQRPAALNIEASDLQVVDKARPQRVQLTATLRNRAAIDVGYPALDLVLTDNREHALARRVILPPDYLLGPQAAQSTIAANAEVTLRVDMDLGDLPAAGFRLNLAHAPIP